MKKEDIIKIDISNHPYAVTNYFKGTITFKKKELYCFTIEEESGNGPDIIWDSPKPKGNNIGNLEDLIIEQFIKNR